MKWVRGDRKTETLLDSISHERILMMSRSPDVSAVFQRCRAALDSACTPRAPKPEWFGDPEKEPGKWDAWALAPEDDEDWRIVRNASVVEGWIISNSHLYPAWPLDCVVVVPVAREGFPAPVGWWVLDSRLSRCVQYNPSRWVWSAAIEHARNRALRRRT